MILNVYMLLMAVCFCLLFYGWYVKADLFRITGSILLFLLGFVVAPWGGTVSLLGDLQYPIGALINVSGNLTYIQTQYSTFTNHTLAFYMIVTAALSLVIVMVDRRTK